MASIACMDDIRQQFSKHFLFKFVSEFFLIFRKKYADGVFTQGSYLKATNVQVIGYINMILNISTKDIGFVQIIKFQMYLSFQLSKNTHCDF